MIETWKELNKKIGDYAELCFGAILIAMWIVVGVDIFAGTHYGTSGFLYAIALTLLAFQVIMSLTTWITRAKFVKSHEEWEKSVFESARKSQDRSNKP